MILSETTRASDILRMKKYPASFLLFDTKIQDAGNSVNLF